MVLNDKIRAYYRDNPLMVSSPFGGVNGFNHALLERVLERLGILLRGRRVLDIGCGRGYLAEAVGPDGRYTGLDLVPNRAGFPLVLGDAADLPFGDGAFDVVCCIDAFEHFPEPSRATAEFYRVLKPGGTVFLSAPQYGNMAGLVKVYCETFGRYEKDTWAPFRQWQPQELERRLTAGRVRRVFRQSGFRCGRRFGYGAEVALGLCPWLAHPRMPEPVKWRMDALFRGVGPAVAAVWPGASLHLFWKFER